MTIAKISPKAKELLSNDYASLQSSIELAKTKHRRTDVIIEGKKITFIKVTSLSEGQIQESKSK